MGDAPRCAVVGAANIDIGGFPSGRMAIQDSNPGRIALSTGGVGHNIACNLARLGVETRLVTALGADAFADIVRAEPGCISYELCRDLRPSPDGKTYATFVEIWESEAALKAHGATPHMCRYREQVADLRAGGQVTVMEKLV